jgi:hypothetical protein
MISSSWHTLFVKKLKTENWILNWNKLNQLIKNNDEIIKIDFRPLSLLIVTSCVTTLPLNQQFYNTKE